MDKNRQINQNPYDTIHKIEQLRKEGVPEKDVAEQLGFVTTMQMRRWKSGFFAGTRAVYREWAKYLEKEGKRKQEIALIIGRSESIVRMLLDDELMDKIEEA